MGEEQRNRPRSRIESFSDLIFGLSLSVGSIALIATSPTSSGEIESHILAFGFTFMMLITAWIIYTSDMSVLPVETKPILFLNVVLLLLVAIVPYLLNSTELVSPSLTAQEASAIRDFASTLFALDLAGILLILSAFAHIISIEEKGLVAPELVVTFRSVRNRQAALAALMIVSLAPQFWTWTIFDTPSRLFFWYVPLITFWVGRALRPEGGGGTSIRRRDS